MNSPKHFDKSCIARFTFNSELECRKQGGVPTNVVFKDGNAVFKDGLSIITYKIPKIQLTWGARIKFTYRLQSSSTSRYLLRVGGCTVVLTNVSTFYIQFAGVVAFTIPMEVEKSYDFIVTVNSSIINLYDQSGLLSTYNRTVPMSAGKDLTLGQNIIGSISFVEFYNRTLSAQEVSNLYNKLTYAKLPTTIKDYTPSCFEGNNSAYIEVPDSDLLSFGDTINPNEGAFWESFWVYKDSVNDIRIGAKYSGSNWEYGTLIYANGNISSALYSIPITNYIAIANNGTTPLNSKPYSWHHFIRTYNGNKLATGLEIYVDGVVVPIVTRTTNGTYVGMTNLAVPLSINGQTVMKSGNYLMDYRIGSGTLTPQQIQDIYQGKRVGTERLWLPLCEDAGNVRFDVSGNGLHGILKGTQDGKYNVGRQPKLPNGQYSFDYYRLHGGSVKALMFNEKSVVSAITFNRPNLVSVPWTAACRLKVKTSYALNSITIGLFVNNTAGAANSLLLNYYASNFVYYRSANKAWDGTGNTVAVPATSILNDQYHTILFRCDGTNTHLYIDGVYKGYVLGSSLTFNSIGTTSETGIIEPLGFIWDVRFWLSDVGRYTSFIIS